MWIENVRINNFSTLRDVDVRLGPGLNVIVTPNEGGKSSLMTSIVTSLYRDASSRSREIKCVRRWGSGCYPRIELTFHAGGEDLRLVRDFEQKKQLLFRGVETTPFRSGKDVNDYLKDRLVLPDEKLFVRVCGARHEELESVSDGEFALGERLEEILGGGWGSASPVAVKQMLEAKRGDIRRGSDRPANRENWGALKRFSEMTGELERELREAEALAKRREELLRVLSEKSGELAGLSLERMKGRKERADRYNTLFEEVEAAEGRMQEARKRKERLEKLLSERAGILEGGDRFSDVLRAGDEGTLDGYRTCLEREAFIENELERCRDRGKAAFPFWKLAAAILLVAGGITGSIFLGKAFFALIAAGIILAAWAAAVFLGAGRGGIPGGRLDELDALRSKRRYWSGDLTLEGSRDILKEFGGWKRALGNLNGRLNELSGGVKGEQDLKKLIESLDMEFGRYSAEWRTLRDELGRLEQFRLEPADMLLLEDDIGGRERETERLNLEIGSMEMELMGLPHVDLNLKIERLASARMALERTKRRLGVIEIVLETLDDARKRIAGFLAERLPPLAGGYLSRITDGRYGNIYVDPVRLKIETDPAEGDIERGPDAGSAPARIIPEVLSQGARDQIYLAVRLALVDLLSEREPQPLFLDDTLVHFDPGRRERALEIVLEFAERHQVLLFTCDPGYGDLGGELLSLRNKSK